MTEPLNRLWLGAMLRAIAKVPAGEKLNIRALREPLGVSQDDAIALIEALIAEERLEAATLRPPKVAVTKLPPPPELRPTGMALFTRLVSAGKSRGISAAEVSRQIFGGKTHLYGLRDGKHPVRAETLRKAEEWIAKPPPAPPAETQAARQHSGPATFELHRDICAFLNRTGVSAAAFGKAVNGDAALVKAIGSGREPRPKTVARIRELIAAPPASLLAARRCARRDPTTPPDTEAGDRLNRRTARNGASSRRAQEASAAKLVDEGVDPSRAGNTFQGALMREVIRRREDEARLSDPVELAKKALRSRGWNVFNAAVHGGAKGRYMVAGKRHPDTGKLLQFKGDELIALARRVNPRAMEGVRG